MKRLLIGLMTVGLMAQVPSVLFEREPPPRVPTNRISAQVTGVGGSQTYFYWVVATYPVGDAFPGGPVRVNDVADTLAGGNFVTVRWPLMSGAVSYDVLRTTTVQYPSGAANVLVAGAVAGPAQVDNTNVVGAYTLASAAKADGFLRLNNQAYAVPEYEMQPGLNILGNLTVAGIVTLAASTPGSVLFVGPTGQVAEDNPNFFYDDANDSLVVTGNLSVGYQELSEDIGGATIGVSLYVGIEGDDNLAGTWWDRHTDTAAFGAHLLLARSRGLTHVGAVIVQDDDVLGAIYGVGFDGVDYALSSLIQFEVDDPTPAATDMGGAIVFSTSLAGTEALVERARITNAGNYGIGSLNIAPTGTLDVLDRGAGADTLAQVGWDGANASAASTRLEVREGTVQGAIDPFEVVGVGGASYLAVDVGGGVGVGIDAPLADFHVRDVGNSSVLVDTSGVGTAIITLDGSDGRDSIIAFTEATAVRWYIGNDAGTDDLRISNVVGLTDVSTLLTITDTLFVGIGSGNVAPTGTLDVLDRTAVTGTTLMQVGWDGANTSVLSTRLYVRAGIAQATNLTDWVNNTGALKISIDAGQSIIMANGTRLRWSSTGDTGGGKDLGISRNAPSVIEVNDGAIGIANFADVRQRDLETSDVAVLGTESLTAPANFGAPWVMAAEFALVATDAVYTEAGVGAGTATQPFANLAVDTIGNRWYRLQYTISASTMTDGALTLTNTTGLVALPLAMTVATHTYYFEAAVAPGAFVFDVVGVTDAGSSFTITDAHLEQIQGGDVVVRGLVELNSITFGDLPAPLDGSLVYCLDCTIASPCAAAGAGALAKRIGGIWVCN